MHLVKRVGDKGNSLARWWQAVLLKQFGADLEAAEQKVTLLVAFVRVRPPFNFVTGGDIGPA